MTACRLLAGLSAADRRLDPVALARRLLQQCGLDEPFSWRGRRVRLVPEPIRPASTETLTRAAHPSDSPSLRSASRVDFALAFA
jgi:hypothetical protein